MNADLFNDARFSTARSIIRDAGRLALSYFAEVHELRGERKRNGQDVVTVADRAVEDLIRGRLAFAFPGDGFLGEEGGLHEGRSGALWVVDPIDGTSAFLHGLRDWCISMALVRDGETELGLIYAPCTDETFVAARSAGAYLNGERIRVDDDSTLEDGLLGLGANSRVPAEAVSGFARALLLEGGMFVRNGSGALMLAQVACGRLVGYYEPHINAWDCLAGLCLVGEAGGWTADFPRGTGILDGGPVIAAAPQVREDLLRLVEASSKARA